MSSSGASEKEGELVGELDNAIKSGDVNAVKAILSDPAMNVNFDGNGNGTALLRAAYFGNIEIVRLLLHKGARLNAQDQNGESAIFRAINDKSSSLDMIRFLIKERADANLPAKDGCTPFMHAARRGYLDIVRELASIGVNKDAVDKHNQTALHMACTAGQLSVVEFLVAKGLRVDAMNVNGETPFFQAISADHLPVAQSIFKSKSAEININLQNKFGWTALHWASCSGNSYAVRWLLAHGANPLLTNQDGMRAAQMAEDASIRQILGEPGSNKSTIGNAGEKVPGTSVPAKKAPSLPASPAPPVTKVLSKAELGLQLLQAARSGELQKVRQLLTNPAIDKDFPDEMAETPLMKACRQGHSEVCEALVTAGANVQSLDKYGDSAILLAAEKSNLDTVKLLVGRGANIHDKNNKNHNVLFRAAYGGNFETVKFLVEHGADVKQKAKDNETALFQSATFGRMNIVRLLVEKGVDINASTGWYTALHCAGYMSMTETIEYLIAQGADWTIQDNQHRTAVDRAENDRTKEAFARAIKLKLGTIAPPSLPTAPPSLPSVPATKVNAHLNSSTTRTPPAPPAVPTTQVPSSGPTPVKAVAGADAGTDRVVDPIALLTDKLYEAAGAGDVEQVKQLLSTPGLRIDQRIQNSETALIQACYVGHLEVVRLLVEVGGADLNLQDQDGWTALHWAAYNGFVLVVVFLLSKGADVSIESKKGSTALQSTSNQAVKDAFAAHGAGKQPQSSSTTTPLPPAPPTLADETVDNSPITGFSEAELNNLLCTSATAGDVSKVRRLLHTPGVNIDFKYQNSETALIQACYEGHLPVAQLLVEKGANLNLRDGDGWTALHWAAYNGNAELVKLLLHKGADATILSKKGSTAQQSTSNQTIKDLFGSYSSK